MDRYDKTLLDSMDELQKVAALNELAGRIILPYVIMAVVLVILAVLLRFSALPDIDTDKEDESTSTANLTKTSIFQFPQLVLGVLAIFVYVGVEVVAVDTIINYGKAQGFSFELSKYFASYTLVAMVLGYIIGIITIPRYLKQENALMISALLGVIFGVLAIGSAGIHYQATFSFSIAGYAMMLPFDLSVFFIAMLGLANAIMWPAIWPLAIDGLGRFTKIGSSLLIMGIAGGALLPLLYGRMVDVFSAQQAYWILIPCYIFIFYYALAGHKLRSWK
jgi:fucose permease